MKAKKKVNIDDSDNDNTAVNPGPEADLDFFRRVLDTIPPASFFSDDAKDRLLQESEESTSESDEIDGNVLFHVEFWGNTQFMNFMALDNFPSLYCYGQTGSNTRARKIIW